MKYKTLIILAFAVITLSFVLQDGVNPNLIYWDARRNLTWDDFQEVEVLDYDESTRINLTLPAPFTYSNGILQIEIRACADKTKFFVLKGAKNKYNLSHAQGHFDIHEIFARKYRKEVSEHVFTTEAMRDFTYNMSTKYGKLVSEYHKLYDTETEHSKNTKMQDIWNKNIQLALDSLSNFSNPKLEIPVKRQKN